MLRGRGERSLVSTTGSLAVEVARTFRGVGGDSIRQAVLRNVDQARRLAPTTWVNGNGVSLERVSASDRCISVAGLTELSNTAVSAVGVINQGLRLMSDLTLPPDNVGLEAIVAIEQWLRGGRASRLSQAARGWGGVADGLMHLDFDAARNAYGDMGILARFQERVGVLRPALMVGVEAAAALPGLIANTERLERDFAANLSEVPRARLRVMKMIDELGAAERLLQKKSPEVGQRLKGLAETLNQYVLGNASLAQLRQAEERCRQVENEALDLVRAHGYRLVMPQVIALATNAQLTRWGAASIEAEILGLARNGLAGALMLTQLSTATVFSVVGEVMEVAGAVQRLRLGLIESATVEQLEAQVTERLTALPGRLAAATSLSQTTTLLGETVPTADLGEGVG